MSINKEELLEALHSVAGVDNAPINASKKRYSAEAEKGEGDGASSMFACGGKIDGAQFSLPCSLFVQGLGELRLPFSPSDIARLIGLSEQAPYGKGTTTIINKSVREARQIDASLLTYHPHNSTFFLCTAQAIAVHAVERLGMDAHNICLDAKPYKLLLYEAGGHFAFHRDTERELGMFGTLIVQLPTLSPHQGGQLVVHHSHHSVTFDFSGSKSSQKFYFTAFFTDCKHMLKLITTGNRACLVFNLVRQSVQVALPSLKPDALSHSVKRTAAALKAWLHSSDDEAEVPEKLFIPLEHKYTKTNLCFAGLKGRDALVAEVLRRCKHNFPLELSFELHVCTVIRHRTCEGDGDYDESEFETEKWVGEDDREVNLSSIEIDLTSELVMDTYDLFHDELDADVEEHEDYMGNYGPKDEYWYHIAMLAIWPKRKTATIVGSKGFVGGLDLVEGRMSQGDKSDAALLFKDLLEFLRQNPQKVLESTQMLGKATSCRDPCKISSRILHLCSQIGHHNDMLTVIDVLASSKEGAERWELYRHKRFGIGSAEVAKMLALAVRAHGWDVCGSLIEEKLLLGSRIRHECEYYAKLAMEFDSVNMRDAAVSIAKKIHTLIRSTHGIMSELTASAVAAVLIMLFTLPECHGELAPSLLVDSILKEASSVTVCTIVVKLKQAGSNDMSDGHMKKYFCLKDNQCLIDLFIKLCKGLTTCELKLPEKPQRSYSFYSEPKPSETIMDYIVQVMEAFLWLEDGPLLEDMVKSIVSESQKCKDQLLLKEIIGCSGFWEKASATEWGRKALRDLVRERIRNLKNDLKPVFTWCQPLARLPNYPVVEAFLKGPDEKFTYYGNFSGLPHARNFTSKYFGYGMSGCHRDGYSAMASFGGRGRAAYCEIRKTRSAFEEVEKQWRAGQEELVRLQSSIQRLMGTMTEDADGGRAFTMDAMPKVEQPSVLSKRLKTDVESWGSSKNHPIVL